MAYTQMISRDTPGCIVVLLDQSGSMAGCFAGGALSKAQGAHAAVHQLLQKLLVLSTRRSNGEPSHYFDLAVQGFTGNALHPSLAAKGDFVSIVELYRNPLRLEQRPIDPRTPAEMARFPLWFEVQARTRTPMCGALRKAKDLIAGWAAAHPRSFPPIVVLITDGASTDGDPGADARAVRGVETADGPALLFCAHITGVPSQPIVFPATASEVPYPLAETMFEMCSELPAGMAEYARTQGMPVKSGSRGMVFNGTRDELVGLLDVGTRMKLR